MTTPKEIADNLCKTSIIERGPSTVSDIAAALESYGREQFNAAIEAAANTATPFEAQGSINYLWLPGTIRKAIRALAKKEKP